MIRTHGGIYRRLCSRTISNYYRLFPNTFPDLKPCWEVNLAQLRKEYRQLQSKHHPDRAGDEGEHSRELNRAYNVLKDPLTRAQYLLDRHTLPKTTSKPDISSDASKTSNDSMKNNSDGAMNSFVDHELLTLVMEEHEALQECKTREDIEPLSRRNTERMRDLEKKLGDAFTKEDLKLARKLTSELKYWAGLRQAIKDWC